MTQPLRRCHSESTEPALGLPLDRAGAMIPADLLEGGEIIILLLKPSLLYIVLGCLSHLTGIGLAALAAWGAHRTFGMEWLRPRDVMGAAALLVALRLTWQFFEWLSRLYVLTDRRIIRIKGVFRVYIFEATFSMIQHTDVIITIRERLFGLGTIAFSTAGTALPEAYWLMIRRPLAVHRKIRQTMQKYG